MSKKKKLSRREYLEVKGMYTRNIAAAKVAGDNKLAAQLKRDLKNFEKTYEIE